jgi:hypothetical protein
MAGAKEDPMTRKGPRWLLVMAIGSLVFVGIAASATHYLQEPYNPRFLEFLVVTALHVVLGGLYLTLASFQFISRIRSRHLAYHRRAGSVLVAVGLIIPFFGWGERVIIEHERDFGAVLGASTGARLYLITAS